MIKIGVTGQEGFVGTHLRNNIKLSPNEYTFVDYDLSFFSNHDLLDNFVAQCDVIVHLAAKNRDSNPDRLYNTNIELVQKLIASLERTSSKPHVIFTSSSQEDRDNPYGRSKKEGRILLQKWASSNGGSITGLIVPNVFGPFGKPHYNSVVATFSHQISHGETPRIEIDSELKLIYVGELVSEILKKASERKNEPSYYVPHTATCKVTELLFLLKYFKEIYQDKGQIPELNGVFELNLFNSYRCYMDIFNHFPVKLNKHTDPRGSFVEILRLGIGGQVSFSTTKPGITRGNHFHTRKIERFAVIKGKALIQLRKIGSDEVLDFFLDGDKPAYVDIPIWYTHNIKNIGKDVLYTNFWINESYNLEDADTFFEEVNNKNTIK